MEADVIVHAVYGCTTRTRNRPRASRKCSSSKVTPFISDLQRECTQVILYAPVESATHVHLGQQFGHLFTR